MLQGLAEIMDKIWPCGVSCVPLDYPMSSHTESSTSLTDEILNS